MKKFPLTSVEFIPILAFALLPLFFDLSYQINLYLTWEGAYRIYLGEMPFRDFGIPMGVCSWLVPALFFKFFGPTLFTLAKAQAFLNIISGLSFRWILLSIGASFRTRLLSITIFSFTYILGLYWPQYNHTVIIFQLVALGFLFHYFRNSVNTYSWLYLIGVSVFLTLSFFSKQDGGGLGILIVLILISVYSYQIKAFKPAIIIAISLLAFFLVSILPFIQFDFAYWFNYGQAPHYSRISITDILKINMEESRWEKLYLVIILGLAFLKIQKRQIEKMELLFTLLVVGILIEAMIFQVTSYVPRDNNIFFHAFACSYILFQLDKINIFSSNSFFITSIILICFLWSEKYWKYADRIISKLAPTQSSNQIVSINTYILEPAECNLYADLSTWKESSFTSFQHIKMPASTVVGIDRFIQRMNKQEKKPIVLNMSELTPLAYEVPFKLERGPLWFHLGVGLFDRELEIFKSRIDSSYYDFVVFENIPTLNNFYPFEIRNKLREKYTLIDSFEAPRIVYPGTIEIYSRTAKPF